MAAHNGSARFTVTPRPAGPVDVERRLDPVAHNPYGAIAAALGIGYVLGGGLFTPLTTRVVGLGLKLGLRVIVLPILAEQLVGLVHDVAGEPAPSGPEPEVGGL